MMASSLPGNSFVALLALLNLVRCMVVSQCLGGCRASHSHLHPGPQESINLCPGAPFWEGDTPQKKRFKSIRKTLLYDHKNLLIKHIFLGAFLFCFYFFDVKLIANKRGVPEAPPIHYPINFTSKKFKKVLKNIYNNM